MQQLLMLTFCGAAAYFTMGWAALHLVIPPGYLAPLFVPSGLALALTLVFGQRALAGIAIGAALTFAYAPLEGHLAELRSTLVWLVPLASCLQALYGAALIKHFIGKHNALFTPSTVLRFMLICGPITCLLGATVVIGYLSLSNQLQGEALVFSWLNWWVADIAGVMTFAPVTLSFIAQPKREWRQRRMGIGFPVIGSILLWSFAVVQISHWESDRIKTNFSQNTESFSRQLMATLDRHLNELRELQEYISTQDNPTQEQLSSHVVNWLRDYPGVTSAGWAAWIAQHERSEFEARMQDALNNPGFHITQRDDARNIRLASDAEYYTPIVLAHPRASSARMIGLNPLGYAPTAAAIQQALKTGTPQASRTIELVQDGLLNPSVVLFAPVRTQDQTQAIRGLVFATLDINAVMQRVVANQTGEPVTACLVDTTGGIRNRMSGPMNCDEHKWADTLTIRAETFEFAGRTYLLLLRANDASATTQQSWTAWLLLAASVLSISVLTGFLLISTGRARQVEFMVEQRTLELNIASKKLLAQQASLAHAQKIAQLGSWEEDANGNCIWSVELHNICGIPLDSPVSLAQLTALIHRDDRPTFKNHLQSVRESGTQADLDVKLRNTHGDEIIAHCQILANLSLDGKTQLFGTVQDVTASRQAQAHIQYLAHYDALTGLPNRFLMMNRAQQALAQARREKHQMAILFIDLDRFKIVNDSLGHAIGDQLLTKAAARLRDHLREEDVLARIGGDEFVLLLPNLETGEDASSVASKLVRAITQPFFINEHELSIGMSVGIAVFPNDGADVEELVKHADTAMYSAKEAGRNTWRYFTQQMNDEATARLIMENNLRRALERNELKLVYQPQVSLPSRTIVGVEALVRWEHPEMGLVSPAQFIPVAEECGMIGAIGAWVLETACRQQHEWQRMGFNALTVAINISALQFRHDQFVSSVRQTMEMTGANPHLIDLEITESALMQAGESTFRQLEALRAMGVELSLDDFGTGYSSLAYLKRLPITKLKLDRSFVCDLPGDLEDAAIASATISLARDLGLSVVAEGVEADDQREYLYQRGCTLMQGYLFAKPLAVNEINLLLSKQYLLTAA